jgi:hypothetical protein
VQVQVFDRFDNPATNDNTDPITLSVASGPGGFDSGSTTTVTARGGIATFSNLLLDTAGGPYTLAENGPGKVTGPDSDGFMINPAAPDHLGFDVQPANATAGVAISPAVTVNVDDKYGNLVTGDNTDQVTLTVPSGPGGFDPASTTTVKVNAGVATFSTLILDTAGSYTLGESTVGGLSGANSNSFTISPAAADHLAFSVQPSNTTAGAANSPAVKVNILDKYGNLETLDNIDQITLTVASGPGNFASGSTTTATVSGGIATFSNLILDTAGSYTLNAATSGLLGATSSSFTINPAAADHLAFGVQPNDTAAGNAITPAVQVQVLDRFGNLCTSDSADRVTLSVASGPGDFDASSTTTVTVNGGIAVFNNLILDTAGAYSLAENATGGVSGTDSITFSVGPAAANNLRFSVQPTNTTAGIAIPPVKVQVVDRFGNLIQADNSTQVTLSIAGGPSGFTPGSTTTVTAVAGIATFNNLVLDTAGNYSLAENATGGLTGSHSAGFTVNPAAPNNLGFSAQPSDASAGFPIYPAVDVTVFDVFGNVVTPDNTDQVTLSVATGPGGFAGSSKTTLTVTGGVAHFNNLVLDTLGSYTLGEFATGGLTGPSSNSFTITSAVPNHLVFSVQPSNTAAGSAISPAVQVEVFDKFGNLLTGDNHDQVTLTVARGPDIFAAGSTTTVKLSAGVATFSNLILDTAGTYTLAENLSGSSTVTGPNSSSFRISPLGPDHLGFSVPPGSARAGVAMSPPVTVSVFDKYNNPVPGDNSDQVALTIASGPAGFDAGSTTTATVSGGVATFSNLILDIAGSYMLGESGTGGLTGFNSNSFPVTAGAPDHLAFSVQPSNTIAGTAISPAVQVKLFDKFGNLTTNDSSDQVTLSVASGPGGFDPASTTTTKVFSGVALFNNLILDTAGTYTLAANSGSVTGPNSSSFTITTTTKADHLIFSVQPTSTSAGAAIIPSVQVEVVDKYGNLITGDNTDQVKLTIASGPGGFDPASKTTATVSGGIATFSTIILDTAGPYTLGESATGGLTGANSSGFSITAASGPPAHLAFSTQPTETFAGTPIIPAVQVKLLDQYGNVITTDNSDQVTVSVASGPGGFDPASTTTVTVSGGIATFSKLILDKAGNYTLGSTGPGGASGPPSSSFTITPYYVADHLGFSVQPGTVAAGSAMQPAVQVDVFDQFGNVLTPDNSVEVALSIASGPGGFDPASTTTVKVSAGVATFSNLIFDVAGTYTLHESALGPITGPDSASFTVHAAASVGRLSFVTQPGGTVAGAAISPGVQVQLFDQYGNPLSSDSTDQVSMAIGLNPAKGTLSGTTTVTASNGIATFSTLSIDKAASGYELSASSNGASKNSTPFSVTPDAATHLVVVTVEPTDITAGTGFTVVVSAEDDFGNVDTNFTGSVTISLANNPGEATLGGTLTVNFVHGVATFTNLTLTVAGPGYSFTFVTPGLPPVTTTDIQVSPAAATQFAALPLSGGMPTAGSGFNVQVVAEDAFGNLNSAYTGQVSVTLASGASGGTLSGPATATAQAGVATFSGLNLSQGGPYGLSFTSGSLKPASSVFTVLAFQHSLPAVREDSTNPTGVSVLSLLGSNYHDTDSNSKPGIALTQTIGDHGVWQYSSNAMRWLNVPAVSATRALLLPGSYQIRFVPALHSTSSGSIIFYAWDGNTGKAGGLASTAASGGTTAFSLAPAQDNVTVTAINHAPTWLPGSAALTPVLPGGSNPAGDTVNSVFAGNFQDVESGTTVGVAVTGLSGTARGSWQYSLDAGSDWLSFGKPSLSAARLLSGNDLIRFMLNATAGLGVVTLQAYAWDQTSGKDGQTANLTGKGTMGGQTAFSGTSRTAGFAINDAPVLSSSTGPALTTLEDVPSAIIPVVTLLSSETDPDPGARMGVAIVGADGPGTWQYSLNGTSWLSMGAVSESLARLLPASAEIRFLPGLHQSGQATLTYRAWDQTEGSAGTLFTVNGTDGPYTLSGTEATATVIVSPVNYAPTWTGSAPQLSPILPGASNPPGASIDSLFSGNFHDIDGDSTTGIAVTGLTGTGNWQYLLAGGSDWQSLGSVSLSTAVLLSGLDEVRFVPAAGFRGRASLQAYAWDGTSGGDGGTASLFGFGVTGGLTAFSATPLTASIAVNTAPTLASSTGPTLPATGAAVAVTTFLAGQGTGLKGVAIVGSSGAGMWQYSLDGKHWQSMGAVSESLVRLLPGTAQLRYVPGPHQSGQATLSYRAWDQTAGTAGSLFVVSGTGGATSLSSTEATATLTVPAVHRAPVWTGRGAALTPVLSNATNPAGDTIAAVFGTYYNVDVSGTTPGIAVTALTGSTGGVWQYSLDGGTTWTAFGAVSPASARLLSGNDRIRFVPSAGFVGTVSLTAYAWDGTSGSDGGTATLSGNGKTGGGTAFSTTVLAATCLVNTAPVLEP